MQQNVTTIGGVPQTLFQTIQSYGIDPAPLFEQVGLNTPTPNSNQDRVQSVALQKLWRMAEQVTQDDGFGIRFTAHSNPMTLHGLGFSWIASNTLLDAFNRLVRYYRLISTAGEVVLEEQEATYCVWYKLPVGKGIAAPASLDAAMALFVQLCRFTKGAQFSPSRVELHRNTPKNREAFTDFFNCEITFNGEENRLYFSKEVLREPLPSANEELARVNDQVVIDYLKVHDKADVLSQIRAIVIDLMPSGTPSQDDVAKLLHVSTRTLQRKLAEKHTSFKAILEGIRQELATSYLKGAERSIAEVTYLLGFTEPSNFSRSFKQWTGETPNEYRARHISS
ncbi:AraC family transcriptional regulator [Alteromonas sp. KUL49]|uniref:AraC family transcriptional regulator n=1 Tax=Alteromonas sp. KUL49 TaxID=2480798 RepID=UPI0010FFB4A3|nr:AraC family transcriptional regulator [Alteromonas sp. KUL49]GEA13542.1 transcriptional regulator [Alteromonas sp. KUL49]